MGSIPPRWRLTTPSQLVHHVARVLIEERGLEGTTGVVLACYSSDDRRKICARVVQGRGSMGLRVLISSYMGENPNSVGARYEFLRTYIELRLPSTFPLVRYLHKYECSERDNRFRSSCESKIFNQCSHGSVLQESPLLAQWSQEPGGWMMWDIVFRTRCLPRSEKCGSLYPPLIM